jgi:anthranilate phosphoribosyltransferase
MASTQTVGEEKISITPLLKRLWHESPSTKPTASEIAAALGLIFTNSLSEVQTGALLTCLHFTDLDRQAEILTKCAQAMRDYATGIEVDGLRKVINERGRKEGSYQGGLVSYLMFFDYRKLEISENSYIRRSTMHPFLQDQMP